MLRNTGVNRSPQPVCLHTWYQIEFSKLKYFLSWWIDRWQSRWLSCFSRRGRFSGHLNRWRLSIICLRCQRDELFRHCGVIDLDDKVKPVFWDHRQGYWIQRMLKLKIYCENSKIVSCSKRINVDLKNMRIVPISYLYLHHFGCASLSSQKVIDCSWKSYFKFHRISFLLIFGEELCPLQNGDHLIQSAMSPVYVVPDCDCSISQGGGHKMARSLMLPPRRYLAARLNSQQCLFKSPYD